MKQKRRAYFSEMDKASSDGLEKTIIILIAIAILSVFVIDVAIKYFHK